jgi:signal transduction histidine kinase
MRTLYQLYQLALNNHDRLMALMMLSLHTVLIWGDNDHLQIALILCHYGFFLLWQPVMHQRDKLSWKMVGIVLVGAYLTTFLTNWWVAAFWIAGLFSLIGGRVLSSEASHSKIPNILAASYLLAILLLWVVPKLLNTNNDLLAAELLLTYVLPTLPLTILFLSAQNKTPVHIPNIDFFYTLLIFLLTIIVILSSFAVGNIWQFHYAKLLIFTVFGLAAILVAISWLWNPSATFSGLELLMSRYLLSIGLPFEQWIRKIAAFAENETSAEGFLQASMHELAALNWVSGVSWQSNNALQEIGETTRFISTFSFQQLHLTLYSRWQFTPAMYLHVQLLTQILGEFYEAKRREETISQNAYMQSLYETGSRLTHDIKNILQSLGTLSSVAEQSNHPEDDARLVDLIKKQLPRLNQRLSSTLNKLEEPSIEKKNQAKISHWWKNFKQLNAHHQVKFEAPSHLPKTDIDPDVLDSVVDNLIQNALEKARLEAGISINVCLMPSNHFCIEVTDTGSAIPSEVAEKLFKSHVSSKSGLGVGLYHAAQQAENAGYLLSLTDSTDGEVRFRLEKVSE